VAGARKLLIAIWYILSNGEADRFATDAQVACSFFALAYKLGIGRDLTHIHSGSKTFKLPPSELAQSG